MRVALLLDWFLYYTVELANALSQIHDVMLITRDHNFEISSQENPVTVDEFLDDCLSKDIIREKLQYRRGSWKNPFEVIRVFKKIKGFRPDVLHIQENTDWRILLLAKLIGYKKVVLTIHDVVRHPGENEGYLSHMRFWLRKRAAKLIVHGRFLKKQLISIYPGFDQKINVIPHGVLAFYKEWEDDNIRQDDATVLFFGRINKYKGLDVLIQAEPFVSKEIPQVKFVIAGRGDEIIKYKDELNQKKQFVLLDRYIPNAEVAPLFQKASVVVLPYVEASQSGVIPIAYCLGRPVIATSVGSIPEVVEEGKTGFIVPPNNPELLAKAIIKILKDHELLLAMGQNALEKAETDLAWNTLAGMTSDIYSSL